MTATNMCSNFVGFRYSPPLTAKGEKKLNLIKFLIFPSVKV